MTDYSIKLLVGISFTIFYFILINMSINSGGEDAISIGLPIFINILYGLGSGAIAIGLFGIFDVKLRDMILANTLKNHVHQFANPIFPLTSLVFGLILCYLLYTAGWSSTLTTVVYYIVVSQAYNVSVRVLAKG